MRKDLNKVLTEAPRIGHAKKFGDTRRKKSLNPRDEDGNPLGGRQSMRRRHKVDWNAKEFGEHLSPLYGWVRSCVGKNWNKCFSELMRTFDTRKVTNRHILEHLWGYIETKTFVDEHGQVVVHIPQYQYRGAVLPIKEHSVDFYVCPKSGMVRENKKKSAKQKLATQKRLSAEAKAEIFRVLDEDHVLRLVNGVWYTFALKVLPKRTVTYVCPPKPITLVAAPLLFDVRSLVDRHRGKTPIMKTWDELNGAERERFGVKKTTGEVYDVFYLQTRYLGDYGPRHAHEIGGPFAEEQHRVKYHASKKTASAKELKAVGISGPPEKEPNPLSHRAASKYRKAA